MSIEGKLSTVLDAIKGATERSGRSPGAVTLVAVTKTRTVEVMADYARAATIKGISVVFGESYLQELERKRPHLPVGSELHMIGPLQSNKIRDAVALCDVIESIHSTKTLEVVAKEAARINKRQRVMLQVNIARDERKSGFLPEFVDKALEVCEFYRTHLVLEGLMTITTYDPDPEQSRPHFRAMSALRTRLISNGSNHNFANGTILLSMGMSDDFAIAIEEGADVVRVGTALFGGRL